MHYILCCALRSFINTSSLGDLAASGEGIQLLHLARPFRLEQVFSTCTSYVCMEAGCCLPYLIVLVTAYLAA